MVDVAGSDTTPVEQKLLQQDFNSSTTNNIEVITVNKLTTVTGADKGSKIKTSDDFDDIER